MTEPTATDSHSNIIWMGEFLMKRLKNQEDARNSVLEIAQRLNKKEDPRQDQFAGPLMAKADRLNVACEATKRHLQFIFRGGFGPQSHVPRQFVFQQSPPPPVNLTVSNIDTTPK